LNFTCKGKLRLTEVICFSQTIQLRCKIEIFKNLSVWFQNLMLIMILSFYVKGQHVETTE
jgi:hypothetical protein